jgi:hypothetical protein
MTNFLISGEVNVQVKHKEKGILQHFFSHNQITNDFRNLVFNSLVNGGQNDRVIQMRFGTGITPATPTDTTLQTELGVKALIETSNPNPNTLVFKFEEIGYEEFNGQTITEYGLFTEAGLMIARKINPPIVKNNLIALDLSWSLTFL